jgi:glycosyltransferase involved in cell wall biosynthesis
MRICLFSSVFLPQLGGIENASLHLADAWRSAGHDVVVLCDTPAPSDYDRRFALPVLRQPSAAQWRQTLANSQILVSNGHSIRYLGLWLQSGIPFGWIHQSLLLVKSAAHGWRDYLRPPLWRRTTRLADFNVCVSEYMKRHVANPAALIIPNGFDPIFRPMPEVAAGGHFLFFGRLIMDKGIDTLIEAVALCRARGKDLRARLVGAGADQQAAESLAARLGVRDLVEIAPPLRGEELVRQINAARAVVIPSHWGDPCPLTVVETLACGKCLIASRDGGIPEIAAGYALLFAPRDAGALAALLIQVAEDDALVRDGEAKALQRAQNFPWRKIAAEYIALFEKTLAERRPFPRRLRRGAARVALRLIRR